MLQTILMGGGFNLMMVLVAFACLLLLIRLFNSLNGYTMPQFFRDCRNEKDYFSISIVLAAQLVAFALLLSGTIS